MTRLRLGLEASRAVALGRSAVLTPSLEAGRRESTEGPANPEHAIGISATARW